jgi:2-amino-4-hydroxy-6-hydroxymethyldihydropteridine diphosphokinase
MDWGRMQAMTPRDSDRDGAEVYVALGSNLGDRGALLAFGLASLEQIPGLRVVAASRIYETDPVGPGPQGAYLNAVVRARATLAPRELLQRMLSIEMEAGRTRDEDAGDWLPRTLDLDLLAYGDQRVNEPGLEIPHPRLHLRAFVLEPLCELAPDLTLSGLEGSVAVWAARVRDPAAVRLWVGPPLVPRDSGSAEAR